MLKELNSTTEKIYDFGIIFYIQNINSNKRHNVVNALIKNGFTVNIVSGFGISRDRELAKCKRILNIHSEKIKIFEHIRCNRLLYAGFNILSESSYSLDQSFIDKHPNLEIIEYSEFFNIRK